MELIAYYRVSSVGQLNGYGLDAQRENVERWAEANGHTIVASCREEGVTGTITERPALAEALNLLADNDGAGLVVSSLDRLAREMHVQEAILSKVWALGACLYVPGHGEVAQDDPDDPMRTAMRQVAGVFAQLDRAMLVKRMRDGKRVKRSQGGKTEGRYPFGFDSDGPIAREQEALSYMRDARDAGLTWKAIAERLNSSPLRPRFAERWNTANARKVAVGAGIN